MNKKMITWIVGGLMTISFIGFGLSETARAAEQAQQMPVMQTGQMGAMMGNMDPKAMAEMMKTPEMQKQCVEMMKNPEMQKTMADFMKTPEIQGRIKQMMQ